MRKNFLLLLLTVLPTTIINGQDNLSGLDVEKDTLKADSVFQKIQEESDSAYLEKMYEADNLNGHIIFYCDFVFWRKGDELNSHSPAIEKFKKRHPFPKNYDPQLPVLWWGGTTLQNGVLGASSPDFHLKDGFSKNYEIGLTFFQVSKNLYKKAFGLTFGFQGYRSEYNIVGDWLAERHHNEIEFVPSGYRMKRNEIEVVGLRIPALIGYQTPYKIFSIQTGLSIGLRLTDDKNYYYQFKVGGKEEEKHHLHLNYFIANWTSVVGLGPLTLTINQGLLPLYKLTNGKKAYESSITFGFDLWWLHRLKRHW